MLEWIMEYMMKRMQQNRDRANCQWRAKDVICSKIRHIIERHLSAINNFKPYKSNNFVDECYSIASYRPVYSHDVYLINGRTEWKKTNFIALLSPNEGRSVGRPEEARRVEPDEPKKEKRNCRGKKVHVKASNPTKLKRPQDTVTCGYCVVKGKNMCSCERRKSEEEQASIEAVRARQTSRQNANEQRSQGDTNEVTVSGSITTQESTIQDGNHNLLHKPTRLRLSLRNLKSIMK